MKEFDFVIVGAGLAGLAAHHELEKKGYRCVTLEASSIPGGRVQTKRLGEGYSDTGAQFLSYNYPRIQRLIDELGLREHAHPASPLLGYATAKKTYVVNTKNPLSPLLTGFLTPGSYFKLAMTMLHVKKKEIQPDDPEDLIDGKTCAAEVCLQEFNEELYQKIFVPFFSAFCYADPQDVSGILVSRALKHMASGKSLMGLSKGLAMLPEALARGKDVRYNTKVLSIEEGVVKSTGGDFSGKRIIIATTETVARKLLGQDFPRTLRVTHRPTVHEGILTKRKDRNGTYGTMVLSEKNPHFNVVTDERFKARGLAPDDHDVLGILRTSAGAGQDSVDGMEDLLGITAGEVLARNTTVWEEAIPVLPPGHFSEIHDYRKKLRKTKPKILLAGDYLSTGCTEGAVESGQFIASLFQAHG